MKYIVCSIRDVVADRFIGLNLETKDASAERNFLYSIRTAKDGILASNPGDFWLMAIGTFDSETGELVPTQPRLIAKGDSIE